jgi:hypothetical protein
MILCQFLRNTPDLSTCPRMLITHSLSSRYRIVTNCRAAFMTYPSGP